MAQPSRSASDVYLPHGISAALSDRGGVAAVEFALIVPVMIALYIGAVEFSHALNIDRRVTSVASSMADLVAQTDTITCDEVTDVFEAASSIMSPYSDTPLSIVVTSVEADKDNKTTVGWSKALHGTEKSKGSSYTLPTDLTQAYSSVIVTEVSYTYTPTVGQFLLGGITMTDKFYLRPRVGLAVSLSC